MVVNNNLGVSLSRQQMNELKDGLTASEGFQSSGDNKSIYESKKNLAIFFQNLPHYETARLYFQEAFNSTKGQKGMLSLQIEAAQNLAKILKLLEKYSESAEYFEQSRKLAKDSGDVESEQISSRFLVEVRTLIANNLCESENHKNAVNIYMQCLDIVHDSLPNDQNFGIGLYYSIGQAHQSIGEIDTAVKTFKDLCTKSGDKTKEGLAQTALASCFESSGNLTDAVNCLTQFISLTESDTSQKPSLAKAYNQLGILYNKMGEYPLSVQCFDKHFAIVTTEKSQTPNNKDERKDKGVGKLREESGLRAKELAQLQLGISRGNAYMEKFFEMVGNNDVEALLKWKSTLDHNLLLEYKKRT